MFKYYIILALVLAPVFGLAQINLVAKNYSGDAILAKYVQGKPYAVDTLKGNGTYSYSEALDKGIYLFVLGKKYFEFPVGEDQCFTLAVDNSKALFSTLEVSGSNDVSLFLQHLKTQDQNLSAVQDDFLRSYLKALESVGCKLANDTLNFYCSRKHFWDNTDLGVAEMLNSPLIVAKMDHYFNRMFAQQPDTIIAAMDAFLKLPKSDSIQRAALSFLLPYTFEHKTMGMEKAFVWLAENHFVDKDLPWLDKELEKKITQQYYLNKFCLVGDKARELQLTRTDGSPFELSGQNGDYTLILFYDISCGSCKLMVEELSEKSTELFLKGVDIVAVNTETDETGWQQYIKEQGIQDWVNVMDQHGDSNYHTVYGVNLTPMIYLLDRNKTIIGKKLTVEQVVSLIEYQQKTSLK